MPNEQRCSDRTAVTLPAQLKTSLETEAVKIVDISCCGIGIITTQQVVTGDDVALNFVLPGYAQNNPLSINAKVIHTTSVRDKHLIGLSILSPSQHDILVLKEFFNFHQRFRA